MSHFDPNDPIWRFQRELQRYREMTRPLDAYRDALRHHDFLDPAKDFSRRLYQEAAERERLVRYLYVHPGPPDFVSHLSSLKKAFERQRALEQAVGNPASAISAASWQLRAEDEQWVVLARQFEDQAAHLRAFERNTFALSIGSYDQGLRRSPTG